MPPLTRKLLVVLVLLLSAYLRLVNLRHSPAWYHDECIFVNQTWNLMRGQFMWDGVEHTYLPRMPLMHLLIMPFFLLFGRDVVWVRLIAALSGIVTTWLVYRIAREAGGVRRAILAALIFAVFPYIVLMNRWGFSYNLDCALGAANLYFLQRFVRNREKKRYLFLAALMAGLGVMVDPISGSRLILTGVVSFFCATWGMAIAASALAALPLFGYVGFMWFFHHTAFVQDVQIIFMQRLKHNTILKLLMGLWKYLSTIGPMAAAGLTGVLFLLPLGRKGRLIVWATLLDIAFMLRAGGPDPSIMYRTGVMIAPAICIGLAYAIAAAGQRFELLIGEHRRRLMQFLRLPLAGRMSESLVWGLRLSLGAGLIWLMMQPSLSGIFGQFPDNYNQACLFSIEDADKTAQWANARLRPDDLVITSHVEWMFNCKTTSPMLADLLSFGQRSPIYYDALKQRLHYSCRLEDARWVILNDATAGLNKHYHFDNTLREICSTWKLIKQQGPFQIYENPALAAR